MSYRSKKRDVGASSSLVLILEEFQTIDSVTGNLNAELLDDGQGVELTLKERKASWHKSCRSAFDNERLVRAKKRRHESGQANESEMSLAAENTVVPSKPDVLAFQQSLHAATASSVIRVRVQKIFTLLSPLRLIER